MTCWLSALVSALEQLQGLPSLFPVCAMEMGLAVVSQDLGKPQGTQGRPSRWGVGSESSVPTAVGGCMERTCFWGGQKVTQQGWKMGESSRQEAAKAAGSSST